MSNSDYRIETDTMGDLQVPADALWGAQTQRAINNFAISGIHLPAPFIHALGLIKASAARVNADLKLLSEDIAAAIEDAAMAVAQGDYDSEFPVDVFQTGSGTSSNMNANEVVARLAATASGLDIHPNDHVNHGQSSNDVIPTAIHLSAALQIARHLDPALQALVNSLEKKAVSLNDRVKTGRTHLMDAMPISLGQEIGAWAAQIELCRQRLQATLPR
jgi:fumarate hydratase class II